MKHSRIQNIATARSKAMQYTENKRVTVLSDTKEKGYHVLRGKVKCDFGFIHHPSCAITDSGLLLSSSCDCFESNEGTNVCSHCFALIEEARGTMNYDVAKLPSIDLDGENGTGVMDFELTVKDVQDLPDGGIKAKGRALCNFGFVHHPDIRIEDGELADYSCDCYLAMDSVEPCPHCKRLYTLVMSKKANEENAVDNDGDIVIDELVVDEDNEEVVDEIEKIEDEEITEDEKIPEVKEDDEIEETEDDSEELTEEKIETVEFEQHEATSMQIVFGKDEEGKEVIWQPNDTSLLFHTNSGIIGTMGTGKTQFTKSLVTQLYREQKNNFTGCGLGILIFDYKGDYNENKSEFVNAVNAKVYNLYRLPFNPFDLKGFKKKPQLPLHAAGTFTDIIQKIYKLGPKQSASLTHCIASAYRKKGIIPGDASTWDNTPPTFADVYDIYMEDESISKNDVLYAAMDKLYSFEIFENDSEKTTSLYDMLNGVVVIDLSGYDSAIQNLVVAFMLELFYSQMQNAGSSALNGRFRRLCKFILVDEADNFLSQDFPALKKILKEGREFGVGTILSTQFLKHFHVKDEDYSKYILTWVVHNVADLKRSDVEYVFNTDASSDYTDKLFHDIKSLESHHSLVKIGNDEIKAVEDLPFFKLIEQTDGE